MTLGTGLAKLGGKSDRLVLPLLFLAVPNQKADLI
jgi:hypothetical protein